MLWTVLHLWLSGHYFLVLRNGDGTANIVHSRESVTQGDPLDIVAYVIGVLPLTKCLKAAYLDATDPRQTDNSGARGTFDKSELF